MATKLATFDLTVPAGTGSETVVGTSVGGFHPYDYFMVDATLTNTGSGTLNVYVQRRIGNETAGSVWRDWIAFPQLSASAGTKVYTVTPQPANAIVSVGTGSATAATPALTANSVVGGHPGGALRLVSVQSGVGTFISQAQTARVTGWKDRHG